MAKINRAVTIDGVKKWIRANTEQEYAEKLIALCQPVQAKDVPHKKKHRFDDYALTWFEIYGRPHLATVTATTYQRQIGLYLLPAFGTGGLLKRNSLPACTRLILFMVPI